MESVFKLLNFLKYGVRVPARVVVVFLITGLGLNFAHRFLLDRYSPLGLIDLFPGQLATYLLWLLTTVWVDSIIVQVYKWSRSWQAYKFSKEDWGKKWLSEGGSTVVENIIHVKSCNSGILLSRFYWKNFQLTFDLELILDRVGIIFRAQNLSDYFMVEIVSDEIRPYVRVGGNWQFLGSHSLKDGVSGKSKVDITVIDENLTLKINSKEVFRWVFPTNVDINILQEDKTNQDSELIPKIGFRVSYGMIGFRCYPGQEANIHDLSVRPVYSGRLKKLDRLIYLLLQKV